MNSPRIDFLIIGAAKCATTSFQHYLSQHPDIYMPMNCGVNQETGYFLKPGAEAIKGLSNDVIRRDVERIFENFQGQRVVGERSTDYSKHPLRTVEFERIRAHNPRMKFLYFVGDPLRRVERLYLHHLRRSPANTNPDFEKELAKNRFYYEQVCSYYLQARRYVDFFGPTSMKVIDVDGLQNGVAGALSEIFNFLKVRDLPLRDTDRRYNVNDGEHKDVGGKIPREMEVALREDYLKLKGLS